MKQYLLSVYHPEGSIPEPEVIEKINADVLALNAEIQQAGVWVFAGGLHGPEASTVVRWQDGEALVTDGPYAEGKEHLGGFVIIKVPDLDAALRWARKEAEAVRLLPI